MANDTKSIKKLLEGIIKTREDALKYLKELVK